MGHVYDTPSTLGIKIIGEEAAIVCELEMVLSTGK